MAQNTQIGQADRLTQALDDYRQSVAELRQVRMTVSRNDAMNLNDEVSLSGYEARSDMLREQLRRLLRAG